MVFGTSDSCNTLVTLDEYKVSQGGKQINNNEENEEYVKTELLLPMDDYGDGDFAKLPEQNLYLPSSISVDEYFRHVPRLIESCDELLANDPRRFTKSCSDRIIYVAQGELGYVLPTQADVIVSDKATTCHILALRSEAGDSSPLASLAHIDSTSYEDCIRKMFVEHLKHHRATESNHRDWKVRIEVHIMGGFDDEGCASRKISCWLMTLLAAIADEYKDTSKVVLRTCAISSMNDNGYSSPIGRGLGLDTRTGEPFLAKVDCEVSGPSPALRAARIWSGSGASKLSVIHTHVSSEIRIEPFSYSPFPELGQLLELPDHILLRYTSTSPDVEEPDFCSSVRSTLRFLRDVKCYSMFGSGLNKPLIFRRANGTSNSWKRAQ